MPLTLLNLCSVSKRPVLADRSMAPPDAHCNNCKRRDSVKRGSRDFLSIQNFNLSPC
jgi:hypothetical protein